MLGLSAAQRAKFELLAHGLGITREAEAYINQRHGSRPLTLADYASTSGVTLTMEDDVWVNAPIAQFNANMVFAPRYELASAGDHLSLRHIESRKELPVRFVPVPAYHDQVNAHQVRFTDYVNTHADRARISPVQGCAMRCKFCDIPYKEKYETQSIVRLIEAAARAFDDPIQPASHLLISGGTPAKRDYDYLRRLYRSVISAFEGIDIDVMMVPSPDILSLDELVAAGVNELSLNVEIWDEERAAFIIPEKARQSRRSQLDFIAEAVDRLGRGRVRSILMVGLEEAESTLEAVDALARVGCVPVLSPFRPDPATELANAPPPTVEMMIRTFSEAGNIAARYGLKLGPHCVPCSHNTLTLSDGSRDYRYHARRPYTI
jgi:organic radical activating enzyme